MKSKTKKNIFVWGGVILFCLIILNWCVLPHIPFFLERNISKEEFKAKRDIAYKKYTNLFVENVRKDLKIDEVKINKSKNAILSFEYQNYYIIVYEINLQRNLNLEKIIQLEKKANNMTPDVTYSGFVAYSFEFLYSSVYDSIAKNIFMSYDQDFLYKMSIGDSIINYNLMSKSLSFRYEKKGPNDLLFLVQPLNDREKEPKKANINVTFYKKGNAVYMIILYSKNKGLLVDEKLIPSLFGTIYGTQNMM